MRPRNHCYLIALIGDWEVKEHEEEKEAGTPRNEGDALCM